MIPGFDINEGLPPGIHETTLAEFKARFATSVVRLELYNKLLTVIDVLKKFNCRAIYVDGSYITTKQLPRDIDICWDDKDVNYQFVDLMAPILFKTKDEIKEEFGIDVLPAFSINMESKTYFIDYFQKHKFSTLPKGILKINIR